MGSEDYRREVRELTDLLSKLNPSAEEFIPPSRSPAARRNGVVRLSADAPIFVSSLHYYSNVLKGSNISNKDSSSDGSPENNINNRIQRRRSGYGRGRRRTNSRSVKAWRDDSIPRTVYVSEIHQHVTEEQLADLFSHCGQVVDCRICGDPHSVLRFAFIEFADEIGAKAALDLGGTFFGYYPVKVLPSKTAILPVNPSFLPKSEDEKEMVTRTVYCTNIHKEVRQTDVEAFFNSTCGEVSRLRLLGDSLHSTCIAFVEFALAESAVMALSCSGMYLGSLPIRVSPSKTPVRPQFPRAGTWR